MDLARFVTLVAAFVTAFRAGDTLRFDERFTPRLADARLAVPRLEDARFDEARFAERLRAEPDFFALDFRPPLFLREPPRADDLRAEDLRAEDLRAEDFFRPPDLRPLFFPRFEPPRDDFLAAAMLQAPI